ncbi:MAG: hypothetical protein ABIP52_17495 [Cyclobacteriaceae bacterium]
MEKNDSFGVGLKTKNLESITNSRFGFQQAPEPVEGAEEEGNEYNP